jgi:hypothetical protein
VTWNVRIADKLVAVPILGFVSKSVNVELHPGKHVSVVADQIQNHLISFFVRILVFEAC